MPNYPASTSLLMNAGGAVMLMNPITQLQVAIKNNIAVHYFATNVNMNALLTENVSPNM